MADADVEARCGGVLQGVDALAERETLCPRITFHISSVRYKSGGTIGMPIYKVNWDADISIRHISWAVSDTKNAGLTCLKDHQAGSYHPHDKDDHEELHPELLVRGGRRRLLRQGGIAWWRCHNFRTRGPI